MIKELYKLARTEFRKYSFNGYAESMYTNGRKGHFQVKYPDGELSQRMAWNVAKNYAGIFGGTISEID